MTGKFFIDKSDFGELVQGEGIVTRIVTGMSGEKMMVVLTTVQPGCEVPTHTHPHEQVGMLQSGSCEMTIADETKVMKPGDFCIFPSDVPHSAKTLGDEPFVMLDIFCPVREDFIEKLK